MHHIYASIVELTVWHTIDHFNLYELRDCYKMNRSVNSICLGLGM